MAVFWWFGGAVLGHGGVRRGFPVLLGDTVPGVSFPLHRVVSVFL